MTHIRFALFVGTLLTSGAFAACSNSDSASSPQSDLDADLDTNPNIADASSEVSSDAATEPFVLENSLTIYTPASGHVAFTDVAKLADGRLLLVYRQGASHVDASGRLMKQFGTADGLSWTDPEVLFDAPDIDDRDPSVAVLSNGDVAVNYFQYRSVPTPSGNMTVHHIFFGRSTDNGKTFSEFKQVDQGAMDPSAPSINDGGLWIDGQNKEVIVEACSSSVIESNGTLYLPSYGGNTLNLKKLSAIPKSRVALYISTDGASSWQKYPILPEAAKDTWLQEPAILQLDDASFLLQMRTAKGSSPSNAGKLMQSLSQTDTTAWQDYSSFAFVGHAPDLAQLSNGMVLSGFRELNSAFTHAWTSFSYSRDRGKSWSDPFRVEDCNATECGYPGIVELEQGRVLVVYYLAGKSIKAAIYKTN